MRYVEDEIIGRLVNGSLSEADEQVLDEWVSESEEQRLTYSALKKLAHDCNCLQSMKSIDGQKALAQVKTRISMHTKTKPLKIVWQRVAAILVFPLILLAFYQYSVRVKAYNSVVWNEVKTPHGVCSKIMLPDSTIVEINGKSTLKYPSVFVGNTRNVELSGEAYFQVKTNPDQPFLVKCNGILIEAVGTTFNVLELNKDEVVASLVEGKVNIYEDILSANISTLTPGQSLQYNCAIKKTVLLDQTNIDKYTAWREGKMIFRNDQLSIVLNQLSRRYNVAFDVDKSVDKNHAFTGTFKDKELYQILSYIELTTPIRFEEKLHFPDRETVISVLSKCEN